jgi:L-malate glycosyltransferase
MRLVLIGDGESPHLLKWARALAREPALELWAVSSRRFLPGFDLCLPAERRLALGFEHQAAGGNIGLLAHLPRLVRWLRRVKPDCLHAHYLTSHGTLAWLARRLGQVPGRLVGSAWGSDILVTPDRGWPWRSLTTRVLRDCSLCTSDSQHMAARMRDLGAGEVMVFPFGLDSLPAAPSAKDRTLVFANRGLEPIYQPERVLDAFAVMAETEPALRLVVANDGSRRNSLEERCRQGPLSGRVRFVGRLSAEAQDDWYARAQWYLSLPRSDSVSVSVLEAMAHGCIPILSDLPANRELVQDGVNGLIVPDQGWPAPAAWQALLEGAPTLAAHNRSWVQQNAQFQPAVHTFVERLRTIAAS